MAAIIFLVGNGLETPDIVDHMLDIEKCPRKPQYGMASGTEKEIPFLTLLRQSTLSYNQFSCR